MSSFQWASFELSLLSGAPILSKISHMSSEEIAEFHKLSDFMYCCWHFFVSYSFEFVNTWQYTLRGESVFLVADIDSTKFTLAEVDLQSCYSESVEE